MPSGAVGCLSRPLWPKHHRPAPTRAQVVPQQNDCQIGVAPFDGINPFHVLCMYAPQIAGFAFGVQM